MKQLGNKVATIMLRNEPDAIITTPTAAWDHLQKKKERPKAAPAICAWIEAYDAGDHTGHGNQICLGIWGMMDTEVLHPTNQLLVENLLKSNAETFQKLQGIGDIVQRVLDHCIDCGMMWNYGQWEAASTGTITGRMQIKTEIPKTINLETGEVTETNTVNYNQEHLAGASGDIVWKSEVGGEVEFVQSATGKFTIPETEEVVSQEPIDWEAVNETSDPETAEPQDEIEWIHNDPSTKLEPQHPAPENEEKKKEVIEATSIRELRFIAKMLEIKIPGKTKKKEAIREFLLKELGHE